MLATTFCESVGDLEGEALVFTMYQILTEAKVKNASDTVGDVETEASADMLANRLAEVKDEKVNETLTDVNGAPLV